MLTITMQPVNGVTYALRCGVDVVAESEDRTSNDADENDDFDVDLD